VLASTEDLLPLYPGEGNATLMAGISSPEVVLKLSEPPASCGSPAVRTR